MSTRRDRAAQAIIGLGLDRLDQAAQGELTTTELYRLADQMLAEIDRIPDVSEMVEASSLGTPGARALRASVSDEQAQRAIDIANSYRESELPLDVMSRAFQMYGVTPDFTDSFERSDEGYRLAGIAMTALEGAGYVLTKTDGEAEPRGGTSPSNAAATAPASPSQDDGAGAAPATDATPTASAGAAAVRPAPSSALPRPFLLFRMRDVTGLSGEGVVAWGTAWPDGTAALRWCTANPTTVHWDGGVDAILAVHGHHGATVLRWLDGAA